MKKEYHYVRRSVSFGGRRYVVRGKTEHEAMMKMQELKLSLERGEAANCDHLSVDSWFISWMLTCKEPLGLTPKSLSAYRELYRTHVSPTIGRAALSEVHDFDLQEILNRQAGRSWSHLSKLRMLLQELFRQAYRSRLIPFNPAEGLRIPEYSKGRRRSITDTERAIILAAAGAHPAGMWVLTMLYAGLRPGETAALCWGDIDFTHGEIHISKAVESGSRRIKETKTPAGIRDIPLRAPLRELLLPQAGLPEELLFPEPDGRVRTSGSLWRWWRSFRAEMERIAGAQMSDDLTPYCLRHTFCTDLQRAEVPINVAKELMGHSSIAVTANIYTHRDNSLLHRYLARMDIETDPGQIR